MKKFYLSKLILNLFDGGAGTGGAAGAAAGAPAGGEGGGDNSGETNGSPASTQRGKSGEYDNVLFGKRAEAAASKQQTEGSAQAPAAGEQVKSESNPEDRKKAFGDMIRGEYKDEFTAEVQRIINNRFKQTKGLEDQVVRYKPMIDALMTKYGIKDGDVAALTQAFNADRENWEDAAEANGMTVEGYRAYLALQNQLQRALDNSRQMREQMEARQQWERWAQEGAEIAKKYPGFDLASELDNPEFGKLLKNGVPMEHAYRVMHLDAIVSGVAQSTAESTKAKMTANIKARGARPAENAQSGQSGFTVKDDVSKLTRKDRAEIARRAARGERITF